MKVNPGVASAEKVVSDLYAHLPGSLEPLGGFESEVFAFATPQGKAILKIISPQHRTARQVQAEVDWLLALAAAHLPVARPLPTLAGTYVTELPSGEVVVAFERAPGATTRPEQWTASRKRSWGELLGRLQAHSRSWEAPGPRRPHLWEQSYLNRLEEFTTKDPEFVQAATRMATKARAALTGDEGLIHADLHQGNLLLDGESWTAIDFDDCAYGPYAFDLAMPIFYALLPQRERPAEEVDAEFLPPFLEGFLLHEPLPGGGAEAIAAALAVRQIELVLVLHIKLPADGWSERHVQLEPTTMGIDTGKKRLDRQDLAQYAHPQEGVDTLKDAHPYSSEPPSGVSDKKHHRSSRESGS